MVLPIIQILPAVKSALASSPTILSAPTGSGKTTLVPLALIDEGWLSGRKIVMLEPRRIAARAAALRMSEILGEPLGETVGYRIRFDHKVSPKTRIEVVTEGILTRMLQNDPELPQIGLVIFDEFHERSLNADLALALCLDLMELRDDLRLLVMSATLDIHPLAKLIHNSKIITGEGQGYPVSVTYLPPISPKHDIAGNMLRGLEHAWLETSQDILAFLPGAGEILKTMGLLKDKFPAADILPLYGELPTADQDRVFHQTTRGKRRIILATPIAETSITLEGIGCVVDCGLVRRPRFNSATGLDRLETVYISKASAEQRRGRAGRLGPGHCYRLWSPEVDQGLILHTPPEIVTADLARLVLELALWGVTDPLQLKWIDSPRPGSWDNAKSLLQDLGAVDIKGHITLKGRLIAALPSHPRLSAMLLAAKKQGLGTTACLLVSLLTERDLLKSRNRSCDLRERVLLFQDNTDLSTREIDNWIKRRIITQTRYWKKLLNIDSTEKLQPEACGILLAFAYPDRLAVLRKGSRISYQLISGKGVLLRKNDYLAGTPFLAAAHVDEGRVEGKIHLAAPVDESALHHHLPELFNSRRKIGWDDSCDRIQSVIENRIGTLVLSRIPFPNPNPEKVLALLLEELQKKGIELLPWTEEARQFQARVVFLRLQKNRKLPDISNESLSADLDWLAPFCYGMTGLAELKKLEMKKILQSLLSWDLLQHLEKEAPTHIIVPSGSKRKLVYRAGKRPVLAVRLQEMFGLDTTPAICQGQVSLSLHLLSPANRPIQITSDLASFWRTAYPEVRKELAGRYPKHYWPENPLSAKPTTLTKKAMRRATQ